MAGPLNNSSPAIARGAAYFVALVLTCAPAAHSTEESGELPDSLRALVGTNEMLYLEVLDRAIYDDLVANVETRERPARPALFIPDLQGSLSSLSALLAFHIDGSTLFAAAVTSKEVGVFTAEDPRIEEAAVSLSQWSAKPAVRELDLEAASILFEALLRPFEGQIARISELIIVPSGPIRRLSFETLLLASVEGEDPGRLPYLVRRYAIGYEPTIGSRMQWAEGKGGAGPIEEGLLADKLEGGILSAELGSADPFVSALRFSTLGACGALLRWSDLGGRNFDDLFVRERAGGNRGARAAARRVRLEILRSDPSVRPEEWAWPVVFGAR